MAGSDDKSCQNEGKPQKYNEYFKLYKSIYNHLKDDRRN